MSAALLHSAARPAGKKNNNEQSSIKSHFYVISKPLIKLPRVCVRRTACSPTLESQQAGEERKIWRGKLFQFTQFITV
jgi:hypothetical protein